MGLGDLEPGSRVSQAVDSDRIADPQGAAEAEERVLLHEINGCVSVGYLEDRPAK